VATLWSSRPRETTGDGGDGGKKLGGFGVPDGCAGAIGGVKTRGPTLSADAGREDGAAASAWAAVGAAWGAVGASGGGSELGRRGWVTRIRSMASGPPGASLG
jgi:hypothetical protein